jgi:hypothetical protein
MSALTLLWRILWPAPEHEHVWTLEDVPQTGYFGPYAHRLVWTCQTCPHREYVGLAWPDASNRRTAA